MKCQHCRKPIEGAHHRFVISGCPLYQGDILRSFLKHNDIEVGVNVEVYDDAGTCVEHEHLQSFFEETTTDRLSLSTGHFCDAECLVAWFAQQVRAMSRRNFAFYEEGLAEKIAETGRTIVREMMAKLDASYTDTDALCPSIYGDLRKDGC